MTRGGLTEIDDLPPWVLRCPEGHTTWQPIDGHFLCRACSRSDRDTDGSFQLVEDARTGDTYDREQLAQLEERALASGAAD